MSVVHRDIKPENVFVGYAGQLVLGDLGLVYPCGEDRLSATLDNVGTRDWAPVWLHGRREQVRPNCDIFSLGKILWALIAGDGFLRYHYYSRPEFNLEARFPDDPRMAAINRLLSKCVVDDESACIQTAEDFIAALDTTMGDIEGIAEQRSLAFRGTPRRCRVCIGGHYKFKVDGDSTDWHNFIGAAFVGVQRFRALVCDRCGHVELFHFDDHKDPPAWQS